MRIFLSQPGGMSPDSMLVLVPAGTLTDCHHSVCRASLIKYAAFAYCDHIVPYWPIRGYKWRWCDVLAGAGAGWWPPSRPGAMWLVEDSPLQPPVASNTLSATPTSLGGGQVTRNCSHYGPCPTFLCSEWEYLVTIIRSAHNCYCYWLLKRDTVKTYLIVLYR